MTALLPITIGGVPEHFNFPWHVAIEDKKFEASGISLSWVDYPGGTGAINMALRENTLDMAVVLTEGALVDIERGNPCTILHWYVKSPLVWGIHTGASSAITSIESDLPYRYAISRLGSGSHLMAYVDAEQRGISLDEERFIIVQNLQGAIVALSKNDADLFMWEKFMTKPYVDNGTVRRVGECPTPWPSFVLVVRNDFYKKNKAVVDRVTTIIQQTCNEVYKAKDAPQKIASRYNLSIDDVREWMNALEWQTEPEFDARPLEKVKIELTRLGIL